MATAKQKLVFGIITENPRVSYYRAMIQAGYSPHTAVAPQKNLISQPGFQELMEKAGVTDAQIAERLADGLDAMSYIKVERVEGVGKSRIKTEEVRAVPDLNIRHKYLETAVKLKGHEKFVPQPVGDTYNTFIQQNNVNPNAPDAKELAAKTLAFLMEQTKRDTTRTDN